MRKTGQFRGPWLRFLVGRGGPEDVGFVVDLRHHLQAYRQP